MNGSLRLVFDITVLPPEWWLGIGLLTATLLALLAWKLRGLLLSRMTAMIAIVLLFITPYVAHQLLASVNAVALVIVDQRAAMQLGNRPEQLRTALENLQNKLRVAKSTDENLQVERYDIDQNAAEILSIMKKYDPAQVAAVFLLTDGEIAGVPDANAWPADGPPLHVLLVGQPGEQQAWMEIAPLPPYALVGQNLSLPVRPWWRAANVDHAETILTIQSDDDKFQQKLLMGEWRNIRLPIRRPGQNRFVLQLPKFDDAVLPSAQTAIVDINGVQNSVHILYQGDITALPSWAKKLRSDAAVTFQTAPSGNTTFNGNDIVILDNAFTERNTDWQSAIVKYAENGGNILMLQNTAPAQPILSELQSILPVAWPDDTVAPKNSTLMTTPLGLTHPITASMADQILDEPIQLTAIPNQAADAKVLLADAAGHAALAIANTKNHGRIFALTNGAILNSPLGNALLRQAIDWLLRKPALADNAISVTQQNNRAVIEYLNNDKSILSLQITRPDRTAFELRLLPTAVGLKTAEFVMDQTGVYRISDGTSETILVHGNHLSPEWQNVAATAVRLAPLVTATGGETVWLSQAHVPDVRFITTRQSGGMNGKNVWLALRESRAYTSTASTITPILPKPLLLCLVFAALAYAWWRESR